MKFKGLLFDLDGTLVNSRADITNSVNYTLTALGYANLPAETIRLFIGEGVQLLLQRSLHAALNEQPSEAQLQTALTEYQRQYDAHLLDETKCYAGVLDALAQLEAWPKAVVTNKPYGFTVKMLAGLGLTKYFSIIFGGDSLPERKPHPLMLKMAAAQLRVAVTDCLMIGDSWVDIAAGQQAGAQTCGYVNGFRGRAELVEAGADYLIEDYGELLGILGG